VEGPETGGGRLARKREKPLNKIGVDEKAIAKGHQNMTLVCNIQKGTIEYVGAGRKTETLERFYDTLSLEQKAGIRAASMDMDMWEPFFQAVPPVSDFTILTHFFHQPLKTPSSNITVGQYAPLEPLFPVEFPLAASAPSFFSGKSM
jgi:hypothetical protein